MRLLLVDDSQFFRSMLAPLLAARGYEVTPAGSAEEALALKDSGVVFDLIISDLDMPGMDGIALAERIKADPDLGQDPAHRTLLPLESAPDRAESRGGLCELRRQVRPAEIDTCH